MGVVLAACGGSTSSSSNNNSTTPVYGGSLTVLEDGSFAGGYASGLDPATNTTGGANITEQQAIFGGLFLIEANPDGSNAHIQPNQAQSYSMSADGKTLTIKLRPGIKFSDGTALDAAAVKFNIDRDDASTCSCKPTWVLAKTGVQVVDPLTVQINFAQPNTSIINAWPGSNVNWMISPTAVKNTPEDTLKVTPIGAGPFTVASDQLSSVLVAKKNPTYFKAPAPYLDQLTFKTIGGDQPAYTAIQAGQADAYEGMSTTPLIAQAQKDSHLQVASQPATSPYVIQLNTSIAPFNNLTAREAIYYATDFDSISKGLFQNEYPVSEYFVGPGGLFYHQTVPGYRTYDLAKAKALVQQLGGLTVNMGTLSAYVATKVMEALQTQWEQAGIKVTTEDYQLSPLITAFMGGKWQAMLQTAGAWDPAAGVGPAFRFTSASPFTGVKDPKLDALFTQAGALSDPTSRDTLYQQIGKYISDNAYAPFGLAFAPANIAVAGVHGDGLTTKIPALLVNSGVIWDTVWRAKS
jgi:peptide/nickel transport system substrate-binding protein